MTTYNLLYPLDTFYAEAKRPLPAVEEVDGEAVPEPYRQLLVGKHDMTPTLEAYHGDRIRLHVLARRLEDHALTRLVTLALRRGDRPVEVGAIVINLPLFPSAARRQAREGHMPLGTILAVHAIPHASCPQAFLRVAADDFIAETLGLIERPALYGRRNILATPDGGVLADIIEILPP
jgi:hypothetical protein